MIEVYFLEVDSNPMCNLVFKRLSSYISDEKLDQILKMQNGIDQKLSLFADLIVRIKATKILMQPNDKLKFRKNSHGKPYLLFYPAFQYNISHTRNAIAVAFSNKQVGIDVEKIHEPDLQIANRFFLVDEYCYIIESNNRAEKFFEIWTKKEAYIKCFGKGLSISLNSFNVFTDIKKYYTHHYNEYLIAIYSENVIDKIVMKHLDEEDLCKQTYSLNPIGHSYERM